MSYKVPTTLTLIYAEFVTSRVFLVKKLDLWPLVKISYSAIFRLSSVFWFLLVSAETKSSSIFMYFLMDLCKKKKG